VPFFDLKFLNGLAASRVGTLNRRHRDGLLSVGLGELVPHGDARNSVLGAFAVGAILLGSFLSGVIAARVLGVSASGTVLYVVWVVVLISPVVDVGLPSAAVRFVSEIRGQGRSDQAERLSRHLARVLAVPVLIASCAIVAILLLYGRVGRWPLRIGEPAGRFGFEALALLLAFFIAVQAFASFGYSYLRGIQAFNTVTRLAVMSLAMQVVCVAVGSAYFGVVGAIAGYAVGPVLPAVASLRLLRRSGPVERSLRERVRPYARSAWIANMANTLVTSRVEVLFLERYWGSDAVAMFGIALALTALAAQGPMLLTTGLLPSLAEKHGRGDVEGMRESFATGTRLLAALAFPACLGITAIMPALLPLIYGAAFAEAGPAAMILACGAGAGVIGVVATNVTQAMGRNDFILFSSLFGAALAVSSGFLVVPTFGVMGAAVARTAIQVAMLAIVLWFVAQHLGYRPPFAALGRLLLAALVAASSAALCVAAINPPFSVLIAVPAAIVAYLVALRMTSALPVSDVVQLAELSRALPSPLADLAERVLSFVSGAGPVSKDERTQQAGGGSFAVLRSRSQTAFDKQGRRSG